MSCAPDIWALGVILFIMLTGIPPVTQPSVVDPRFKHIAAVSEDEGGRALPGLTTDDDVVVVVWLLLLWFRGTWRG